ncbi:hypothetical protein NQZ68_027617 [Dissostichus eleginoides]|nr:hypothetical protein NQZ68_027617 [Dissostichus eleginoides]
MANESDSFMPPSPCRGKTDERLLHTTYLHLFNQRKVAQLPAQITAEGSPWTSKTEHFLSFGGTIRDTSDITCGPE